MVFAEPEDRSPFRYRDLAIEWMIDWLAYDTAYGDT